MEQRTCEYCGKPLSPDARRNQRFCGKTHKRQARRQAKRREELHDRLVTQSPLSGDVSLTELHARAAKRDWRDDPRNYSDFGEVPGDFELAAEIDAEDEQGIYYDDPEPEIDEQTARIHSMLQADEDRRRPRRSWFDFKKLHNRNPGVEKPDITQERAQAYKDDQTRIKSNLRDNKGQPQNRFNEVTKDVVARKGRASRQQNLRYATTDPRPVSQRQEFSFQGESVDGGFLRRGPGGGYRSPTADYQWRMDDGFRF